MKPLEGIEFKIGDQRDRQIVLDAVEPFVLSLEEDFPISIAQSMEGCLGKIGAQEPGQRSLTAAFCCLGFL